MARKHLFTMKDVARIMKALDKEEVELYLSDAESVYDYLKGFFVEEDKEKFDDIYKEAASKINSATRLIIGEIVDFIPFIPQDWERVITEFIFNKLTGFVDFIIQTIKEVLYGKGES